MTIKIQTFPARAVFNQTGKPISFDHRGQVEEIAKHTDDYYLQWNKIKFTGENKGLGIGALIALFEMVSASILGFLEKSPATVTNLLTTLAENFQVLIASYGRSNMEIDKVTSPAEQKELKDQQKQLEDKSEVLMSLAVAGAGVLGLYKGGKELVHSFKGEEDELRELPLWQKTGLATASIISALMMGIGYFEKSTMATLAKNENGGLKAKQIILNAHSDWRCMLEWLAMPVFLWVRDFKWCKLLFDIGLPLNALQDGLSHLGEHYLGDDHNHSCEDHDHHSQSDKSENWLKRILRKLCHGHNVQMPKMFYNKFFLGNSEGKGVRSNFFLPLFRVLGCQPFECHKIDNDNLFVSIPDIYINVPVKDEISEIEGVAVAV